MEPGSFKLHLCKISERTEIDLSDMKDNTLAEVGVNFSLAAQCEIKYTFFISTPTEDIATKYPIYDLSMYALTHESPRVVTVWKDGSFKLFVKSDTNSSEAYVGLVNQAMTCYLNSLLQALYMTPEFRNALYNWEYVDGSEKDEANSIPYQLQKLFLNLQTSKKSAVETTALTKSFGWDSTEAWQQHDIQELCRVMFDALEQKFKNTEQADLINRLYEGKMIDYVKCLECGTEKSREDTFLDIPLPVRPFGSNVAYNSVEEAIRAFVQYETLEGTNQYHCEKCNKKCNAHKGLKFTKFPYLLTLHLKRFDFDYKTFHRIKLNDKVTFPDVLNLNSFISSTNQESPGAEEDIGLGVKCDDSSTTDSGTLDDECPPCDNSISNSNHSTNHDQEDDEGIDMSNCPSTSNCSTHHFENEKNRNHTTGKGPYQYELFSIMIHSGSASGGHYYAYIKDFRTQKWLCFNDQSVTQITHDDIQKTYGGGPTRAYYSGAYSSSTNAYMLMYRQIDPARNCLPIQAQDFPRHIQDLLKKMKESEDNDRKNYEKHMSIPKLIVYCHHPVVGKLVDLILYVIPDITWAKATEQAYKKYNLEGVVSLDQCRLVSYDHYCDLIECSYEGREQETVASIWRHQNRFNLLLEIRGKDQKFETYLPGGVSTKVYVVDVPGNEVIDGPINVRALLEQTVRDYKQMLEKIINMDAKQMKLVLYQYAEDIKVVMEDDNELDSEGFYPGIKVFVSTMFDLDSNKGFHESALYKIVDNFGNVISLLIQLPDTSKEALEELNIPSLEDERKEKEKSITNGPSKVRVADSRSSIGPKTKQQTLKALRSNEDGCVRNVSPQLGEGEEWNTPEQSNSEDSSLSDSDKTLVGDAPEEDDYPLVVLPPRTSDKFVMLNQIEIDDWDIDDDSGFYFKAMPCTNSTQKTLKVLVDKRMRLSTLKKDLEPYIGVSVEYFKVFRQTNNSGETECCGLTEELAFYDDGVKLNLKLGRALRSGEFKVKLYQLLIDSTEPYKFLCEWIVSKDMTVGQAKKEILAEIKRKYDINIPYEKCRLRKKYYRTASKVLLDEQKFDDLRFYSQFEMIVQELPDKETVTDSNQVVVFVRRWSPAKMQLGQFQEIVMDGKSIEEMREKISSISDIPEDCIDIARVKGCFPCDISVLRVQNDHDWNEHMLGGLMLNNDDGSVFLYRDCREKPKQLSHDEIKEIASKESSRLILSTSSSYNSPRRERALKIYLDTK
ncbi:hypothetical protein KM043_017456 [Ampulex compressa]|nr:hypothetical protein KM043_017456 [Ampulex compressa]